MDDFFAELQQQQPLSENNETAAADFDVLRAFRPHIVRGEISSPAEYPFINALTPGVSYSGLNKVVITKEQRGFEILLRPDVSEEIILQLTEQILLSYGGTFRTTPAYCEEKMIYQVSPDAGDEGASKSTNVASTPAPVILYSPLINAAPNSTALSMSCPWSAMKIYLGVNPRLERTLLLHIMPSAGGGAGGGALLSQYVSSSGFGATIAGGGGVSVGSSINSRSSATSGVPGTTSAFSLFSTEFLSNLSTALNQEGVTANMLISPPPSSPSAGSTTTATAAPIGGPKQLESLLDIAYVRDLQAAMAQRMVVSLQEKFSAIDAQTKQLDLKCARMMTMLKPSYVRAGLVQPSAATSKPHTAYTLQLNKPTVLVPVLSDSKFMLLLARRAANDAKKRGDSGSSSNSGGSGIISGSGSTAVAVRRVRGGGGGGDRSGGLLDIEAEMTLNWVDAETNGGGGFATKRTFEDALNEEDEDVDTDKHKLQELHDMMKQAVLDVSGNDNDNNSDNNSGTSAGTSITHNQQQQHQQQHGVRESSSSSSSSTSYVDEINIVVGHIINQLRPWIAEEHAARLARKQRAVQARFINMVQFQRQLVSTLDERFAPHKKNQQPMAAADSAYQISMQETFNFLDKEREPVLFECAAAFNERSGTMYVSRDHLMFYSRGILTATVITVIPLRTIATLTLLGTGSLSGGTSRLNILASYCYPAQFSPNISLAAGGANTISEPAEALRVSNLSNIDYTIELKGVSGMASDYLKRFTDFLDFLLQLPTIPADVIQAPVIDLTLPNATTKHNNNHNISSSSSSSRSNSINNSNSSSDNKPASSTAADLLDLDSYYSSRDAEVQREKEKIPTYVPMDNTSVEALMKEAAAAKTRRDSKGNEVSCSSSSSISSSSSSSGGSNSLNRNCLNSANISTTTGAVPVLRANNQGPPTSVTVTVTAFGGGTNTNTPPVQKKGMASNIQKFLAKSQNRQQQPQPPPDEQCGVAAARTAPPTASSSLAAPPLPSTAAPTTPAAAGASSSSADIRHVKNDSTPTAHMSPASFESWLLSSPTPTATTTATTATTTATSSSSSTITTTTSTRPTSMLLADPGFGTQQQQQQEQSQTVGTRVAITDGAPPPPAAAAAAAAAPPVSVDDILAVLSISSEGGGGNDDDDDDDYAEKTLDATMNAFFDSLEAESIGKK